MEPQKPKKHHPLSLGVTQDDIEALQQVKEIEQNLKDHKALVKIKISRGYIYTTNPDKYKNSDNINIIK